MTVSLTWSSSDTAAATVSNTAGSEGLAVSAAAGTTTVTASDPASSVSGTTQLTVTPADLVSIEVTPTNPSIALGTGKQFTATGTFTDGTTQNLTAALTWSSADTAIATINTSGLVASVAVGATTITATDPGTNINGTTQLTVTPAELVLIAVTPTNPQVALGLNQQFIATGTFTDGTTQDLTTSVTWSSSDTNIATISNALGSEGLTTSVSEGATTITATDTVTTVSGLTTLTVTPEILVLIAVTPGNPLVALGLSQQFTATGTFSSGTNKDITTSVTWSSSDVTVATVSNAAGSRGLAASVLRVQQQSRQPIRQRPSALSRP